MASLYVLHLILAGLLGINSKTTVSKVSVKAGASVSIPCLYDSRYINHVKGLCKGYTWSFCSYAVKTNGRNSGKFSISDDKSQRIFTVTIKDLTTDDTDYWCAVEIDGGSDVREYFQLSVTRGTPSLYVDQQEITGFVGDDITINCYYHNSGEIKWCKLGGSCVTSRSMDRTRVTISASVPNVFTVTMSGLSTESSGWYLCVQGDLQMPVHITVHALTSTTPTTTPTTTTTTTTTTPSTANIVATRPTTTQHSSLLVSAEPHTAQPTNSTINGTAGQSQQDENKSPSLVIILTTTLILLLLVVLAAFFGWKMTKRCHKTQPQRSDVTAHSHTGSDPDVQYATVVHNQHAAAKQKQNEDSVTYSDIVLRDRVQQMAEPADGSVIYSTVQSKTD